MEENGTFISWHTTAKIRTIRLCNKRADDSMIIAVEWTNVTECKWQGETKEKGVMLEWKKQKISIQEKGEK